ncbi:MAG: hypothetical protein U0105_09710 [Candidatus Obscuribacterales bacterium]
MLPAEWKVFFPFAANTRFKVDGPLLCNGDGLVKTRTEDDLSFRIDVPPCMGTAGFRADILVRFVKEGDGNHVLIKEDGKEPDQDDNARIISNVKQAKRNIFSGRYRFELWRNKDTQAKLKVWEGEQTGKEDVELTLKKK